MDWNSIDEILTRTLDDYKLSRSERSALSSVLDDMKPSDTDLAQLRSRIFDRAREALDHPRAKEVLTWAEDMTKLLVPGVEATTGSQNVAFFSPDDDCVRVIRSFVLSALRSLSICVFTITDDRIADAIHEAHRRGVSVRILTDDDKSEDLGSDIGRLAAVGVPVAIDLSEKHMHHKFAVADAERVLTGSYNWTRSASEVNEENIVVSDDPLLVKAFLAEFDKLWTKFGR